jgi:uncharacterized protein
MMESRFSEFEWDEHNEEHIWQRHRITPEEVEECFFNAHVHWREKRRRKGKAGQSEQRYYLLGQTDGGRYLAIVFKDCGNNIVRPITAWDMDEKDKRRFTQQRRR